MEELALADLEKVTYFTLKGKHCHARLLDVIDGDTIIVMMKMDSIFSKFRVRLKEIDTCEMKSKNTKLQTLARKSQTRLLHFLARDNPDVAASTNQDLSNVREVLEKHPAIVYVECCDFDNFGRLLAYVYPNEHTKICASRTLLQEQLAFPYKKKRMSEDEQLKYLGSS